MGAFEKLSRILVTEVPVGKVQTILERRGDGIDRSGSLCGGGCNGGDSPVNGLLCGLGCRPKFAAADVIDPQGDFGVTPEDLIEVRADLPKLRQAVVQQLEVYLNQFK
ncbi:MAG: hypothetical protein HXY30_20505 [Pseudorhodoplanes sp.]|nr:hypothetical protein [Pseudorhodoplanes sp.]